MPNHQTAKKEKLLAKVIMREILGHRQKLLMQTFDLSKRTIDETCEAHYTMHCSCSPLDKSENVTASPSIGNGFYSKDELCTREKRENYCTPDVGSPECTYQDRRIVKKEHVTVTYKLVVAG